MSTIPDPDSDSNEVPPILTPAPVQGDVVDAPSHLSLQEEEPAPESESDAPMAGSPAEDPTPADAVALVEQHADQIVEARKCLDCGSELDGPYCASCGQRDVDRVVPLADLVGNLLDELTGLQARLWRTLRLLVTRPGFLTEEFVAGRRISYVAPVRLYLLIALGFFFLVTSFDPIDAETSAEMIASEEFASYVRESGLPRELFVKKFLEGQNSSLPMVLLIVMIPSLALVLKLFYLGSRISYVQHLVFAFHFFSIVLLSLVPGAATAWIGDASLWLYGLGFVALGVWLYMALQSVYHQATWKTVVKFLSLYFAFILILAICFEIAESWAVRNV